MVGAPGVISVDPSLPPSFLPRPVQKQARQHVRAEWCFHQVSFPSGCSPTSLLPPAPQPAGSASDFRRFRLEGAGNPITFLKGAPSTPQAAKKGSGGRAAAEAAPPPPPGPPGPGSPGRGEPSRGGARGAAAGTICPSACRAAAPAPTSTGLSGRRLAKGFPRRAPPANRRRAGGARGPRTRTFQDPRLTRTASTPRTLPFPPRPGGRTRASLRGLFQVQAWNPVSWAPDAAL